MIRTKERKRKTEKEVEQEKKQRVMQGIATWASFYRANPHRFCKDYLNIELHLFQKILLFMMNVSNFFMYIASRGQGKTFLTAIFCVCRCILYPDTQICVASGTRGQALDVLKKITDILIINSENLRLEIKAIKNNTTDAYIEFKNGSKIFAVTSNQNSRGKRCHILIIDEFRMVNRGVLDDVLRKFSTVSRQPHYLSKPEYSHLLERNKEIYLSSAWFKSHWSFDKLKAYAVNLVDDTKQYFVCGLPYELSIKEGLLDRQKVEDEMSEADFNELSWGMEMECLWFGDTDGSLFNYDTISQNRRLENAIYPRYITEQLSLENKLKIPSLVKDERRILSADIALIASKKQNNDAASIFINSAIPTSSGKYISNFIYTENYEGLRTEELALCIRRLFEMYSCTDLVIDVKGLGIGVYDALADDIYDPEYGVTYPALSCCNDSVYAERCTNKNAPKVIWAIQATSQFNNEMYLNLREGFNQRKINLLVSEFEAEEKLNEFKEIKKADYSKRNNLKMPYIHTTLLINELINLEYEVNGSIIKVKEKSGMRKDRVSSVGYNYWVVSQLEIQLKKKKANQNIFSTEERFCFKPPKIK